MNLLKRALVSAATFAVAFAFTGTSAQAMGSGNIYEDLQVGVSYAVYEPNYTAGLKERHSGATYPCPKGTDENVLAEYGSAKKSLLTVIEGNPLCGDPGGAGKVVKKFKVQGATATMIANCYPGDKGYSSCDKSDIATVGGYVSVTLPSQGNLKKTFAVVMAGGAKPMSAAKLERVVKSMTPIATNQNLIGGMVTCTQADLGDVIQKGLSKGQVLVSVNSFTCADGWAYAFATTGDGKGNNIEQTFVFEAEGQFWIPKNRAQVCGTVSAASPGTRPADSQVPASIWSNACNTN